jgi:hypothetical protein
VSRLARTCLLSRTCADRLARLAVTRRRHRRGRRRGDWRSPWPQGDLSYLCWAASWRRRTYAGAYLSGMPGMRVFMGSVLIGGAIHSTAFCGYGTAACGRGEEPYFDSGGRSSYWHAGQPEPPATGRGLGCLSVTAPGIPGRLLRGKVRHAGGVPVDVENREAIFRHSVDRRSRPTPP